MVHFQYEEYCKKTYFRHKFNDFCTDILYMFAFRGRLTYVPTFAIRQRVGQSDFLDGK